MPRAMHTLVLVVLPWVLGKAPLGGHRYDKPQYPKPDNFIAQ